MTILDQIAFNLLKDAVESGNFIEDLSVVTKSHTTFHIPNKEILKILSDYLKETDYINQAEAIDWLIESGAGPKVCNKASNCDAFWGPSGEERNTLPNGINTKYKSTMYGYPKIHNKGPIEAYLWLLENWNREDAC